MVTAANPVVDLQTAIGQLEQVGAAGAAPFIKSASGQATEEKVIAEVNLANASLPLLLGLAQSFATAIHNFGSLFHLHAKAAAQPPAPPAPSQPS